MARSRNHCGGIVSGISYPQHINCRHSLESGEALIPVFDPDALLILEVSLKLAVWQERYEDAARLRDKIIAMNKLTKRETLI